MRWQHDFAKKGRRKEILSGLLHVAMRTKSSDEAFFHGVHMAEVVITNYHLAKSQTQHTGNSHQKKGPQNKYADFMLTHPQYCYCVCLYMANKFTDRRHFRVDCYLWCCKGKLLSERNIYNESQIEKRFVEFELEICRVFNS